ncbi:MAG: tRNA1(Val) (adenine(37)-N6)-methyltransferase [Firmicutes bacterium]|nr:tRNA1(Val) (adenine(37)-N6)-methyltransferase [Bacillota bacterium]
MLEKKMEPELFEGERLDEIGFGGLTLVQKPEEFCYGVDAVILADFAAKYARRSFRAAIDLGTGTGIIPLILSYKTEIPKITGIEVQKDSFGRAMRNTKNNGLEGRVSFIHGDVKDFRTGWGKDLQGSCDLVTSNPPYTAGNSGLTSSNPAKLIARHETTADLEDFMKCAAWLLRDKGEFFMVHRPSRIVDICCLGRQHGLEVKELQFVSPNREGKPNILLVHMVKGGGREAKMLPPLYVYDMEGNYTPELLEAYR